jgi:hypothetical protein
VCCDNNAQPLCIHSSRRIGGRMVEPLCNLLDSQQPEAAAAAAELLALLAQTGPNRARIVAAGGIPRLVALMRQASSSTNSSSGLAGASPYSLLQSTATSSSSSSSAVTPGANKAELVTLLPASTGGAMSAASAAANSASSPASLQEAAAQAALQALAQLTRGDAKLCAELLSAQVMPGLLQLLCSRGCCAAALALIGDLAALPEGRRALHYADGFAALSQVAQVGSDAAASAPSGEQTCAVCYMRAATALRWFRDSATSSCTCSPTLLRGFML